MREKCLDVGANFCGVFAIIDSSAILAIFKMEKSWFTICRNPTLSTLLARFCFEDVCTYLAHHTAMVVAGQFGIQFKILCFPANWDFVLRLSILQLLAAWNIARQHAANIRTCLGAASGDKCIALAGIVLFNNSFCSGCGGGRHSELQYIGLQLRIASPMKWEDRILDA